MREGLPRRGPHFPVSSHDADPSFPHKRPGCDKQCPPHSLASSCHRAAGLLSSVTRPAPARPSPRCSPAHQLGWSFRPPWPLIPAPKPPAFAAQPGHSPPEPEPEPGLWVPVALRPGASFHSYSDQGLLAATSPLPVRNPWAVAPPGASLALPACPSFEPPWIAVLLRGSLHRLSDPSSLLRPIRVASGAPYLAHQSVAQLAWYPRPRSLVRSLRPQAVRQASAPQAFRPKCPLAPFPRSSIHWATLAHRLGLRGLDTHGVSGRYQRPRTVSQVGWPRAWPPCLRPGLSTSAPAPKQPGHPCLSARHPRLPSPVQPECQLGAHGPVRQSSFYSPGPAGFAQDRASWPRPPRPPARPWCGFTCRFAPYLLLCPARSVKEFSLRPHGMTSSARSWALPRASWPRPLRPPAAGPPPLVARDSPSPRDLPHTPLSRTPIWALTARPHSSNRAGGALGPEAELFAGAASRDVASMVVAAATSQNQQLRARQASGAAILGRCASSRAAAADRHLEKVSS